MHPKTLSRLALTLLLLVVSTAAVQAFPVTLDPQSYTIGYHINNSNRLFGVQTLDLPAGTHSFNNGAGSGFNFTVDAAGQITNITKPVAATVVGSTIKLQNVNVTINPQGYTFGIRINGSNRIFGAPTLPLIPGLTYNLDSGAGVGTSSFFFDVDAAGQITNITKPVAAIAAGNTLTLQNVSVTVNPQGYTFGFRINGSNRIFGAPTLLLIPGLTYNLDSGAGVGTSSFFFDVDATGQITNITKPAAAVASGNLLTLQNVSVTVNPQSYTFGFRINGSNRIFGAPTLTLLPGLTYNLDCGPSVGTSSFFFDVDATGQVTNITKPVAATAAGNTLTLQNVNVTVNPQAYIFGFRINASNRIFGAPTLALIPGLTFSFDSGPSAGTSGFLFDVAAGGQITNITQPFAATALGSTIILANVRVRVEPVTYTGSYSINQSPGMTGTKEVVLVPQLNAFLLAQGQSAFFTATAAQVTPSSVTLTIAGQPELFRFSVDQAPPSTAAQLSAQPNAAGWFKTDVTVTLSATDNVGGSGVQEISYTATGAQTIPATTVSGATTSIFITAEGQTTITFSAKDQAGNIESTQTLIIKIDKSAPAVACGSADSQWHATDASITCIANDGVSGLASSSDATFTLVTSVPAGTETADALTGSRQVCDQAGNCLVAGPIGGNKIDKQAPAITISSPAAGAYLINQPVTASYGCTDGGAGVGSCAGPVANGGLIDTSSVGVKTFTVTAQDQVGNSAAPVSTGYTVTFGVRALYDQTKAHKSGSTVPIKLQLVSAGGANLSSSAIIVHAVSVTRITGAASTVVLDGAGNANPDNDFRYDPTLDSTGGYIFNLKTTGFETGTYELKFTAQGGSTVYSVQFQVRQ